MQQQIYTDVLFAVSQYTVWSLAHSFSHRHWGEEGRGTDRVSEQGRDRDVSIALGKCILWLTGSAWTSVLSMLLGLMSFHTHPCTQSHKHAYWFSIASSCTWTDRQMHESTNPPPDCRTNARSTLTFRPPNAYSVQMSIKKHVPRFRFRCVPNTTIPRQE